MWLPTERKIYVWQGSLEVKHQARNQVPDHRGDGELIAISSRDAEKRNAEAVKQDAAKEENARQDAVKQNALLLKEMDETNNWARLGAQLYFGWFTLMITINGVAIGWLFSAKGVVPRFARLLFLIFVVLNLMGTIVAYFIRKHMLDCDRRIQEVLAGLKRNRATEGVYFEAQSPVPRQAINTVFTFTGTALLMLLIFWTVLEIWPQVFLAPPPVTI